GHLLDEALQLLAGPLADQVGGVAADLPGAGRETRDGRLAAALLPPGPADAGLGVGGLADEADEDVGATPPERRGVGAVLPRVRDARPGTGALPRLCCRPAPPMRVSVSASSRTRESRMSAIRLRSACGSMPCSSLYACCLARRRLVSSIARCIDGVTVSAYMWTWPDTLRAARPIVWMRDVSERRKPSLSASRIATSDTSGRSRPSRSRLMPTSTSNSPERSSRSSSMRRSVSTSLCR